MTTTQAIQKPQAAPPPAAPTFQAFLESRAKMLADVLPRSSALTPEKLIKLTLSAAKKNPALLKCDVGSVFNALLQLAELGLNPSGATGEAYLVPYKDQCTPIIGYRGYIKLARQSGHLKQIETHVVHEGDKFTLRYGLDPVLDHEPDLKAEVPGRALIVYCVARLPDGAVHVEVMTVAEVNRIRDEVLSKMREKWQLDASPWTKHWEEMARKTVLRRASKYLPLSAEMEKALQLDDSVDGEVVSRGDAMGVLTATTRTEQLKETLASKKPSVIVDVLEGETEAEAMARVAGGEPPADVILAGQF